VSAPALRPLGIGEILDVGIKIYWRHALTLFKIVVFVVLPAQILVNIVQVSSLPPGVTGTFSSPLGPSFNTNDNTTFSGGDFATFIVGFVGALLINALAGKLAQAGCFRAVADAYLGERMDWRSSLRYALKRLPAVVGVSILVTILVGLGSLLCLIPGIYLWGAFYVAIPVVLVEGVGPFRALGRSRDLVQGRWWSTFGVAVVGYVLVFLVSGGLAALVLGVAASGASRNTAAGFVLNTVATTVGSMLTTPAVAAFTTVLYIDLRVRKEGFDLLLLAQRLGTDTAGLPANDFLPPAPAYPAAGSEQPPYWPPPPGWQPSGGGEPAPPAPNPAPAPPQEQPPFWPPPPGWTPGNE
jgi:hypothetical protein